MEMKGGYSVLPYGSTGLMNIVFTISFSLQSKNTYDEGILDLFF